MAILNIANGIIFGRPLFLREDYDITYDEATLEALKEFDFPIIMDADIGHLAPTIPIVNGSVLEIKSANGKGSIKNIFI